MGVFIKKKFSALWKLTNLSSWKEIKGFLVAGLDVSSDKQANLQKKQNTKLLSVNFTNCDFVLYFWDDEKTEINSEIYPSF